jgi:hypothetical protein
MKKKQAKKLAVCAIVVVVFVKHNQLNLMTLWSHPSQQTKRHIA